MTWLRIAVRTVRPITQCENFVNSRPVNKCWLLSRVKLDVGWQDRNLPPKGCQHVRTVNQGHNGLPYLCLRCGMFLLITKMQRMWKHVKAHGKTDRPWPHPSSRSSHRYCVMFWCCAVTGECTRGSMLECGPRAAPRSAESSNSSPTSHQMYEPREGSSLL